MRGKIDTYGGFMKKIGKLKLFLPLLITLGIFSVWWVCMLQSVFLLKVFAPFWFRLRMPEVHDSVRLDLCTTFNLPEDDARCNLDYPYVYEKHFSKPVFDALQPTEAGLTCADVEALLSAYKVQVLPYARRPYGDQYALINYSFDADESNGIQVQFDQQGIVIKVIEWQLND